MGWSGLIGGFGAGLATVGQQMMQDQARAAQLAGEAERARNLEELRNNREDKRQTALFDREDARDRRTQENKILEEERALDRKDAEPVMDMRLVRPDGSVIIPNHLQIKENQDDNKQVGLIQEEINKRIAPAEGKPWDAAVKREGSKGNQDERDAMDSYDAAGKPTGTKKIAAEAKMLADKDKYEFQATVQKELADIREKNAEARGLMKAGGVETQAQKLANQTLAVKLKGMEAVAAALKTAPGEAPSDGQIEAANRIYKMIDEAPSTAKGKETLEADKSKKVEAPSLLERAKKALTPTPKGTSIRYDKNGNRI